jgi:hypothetical protein
VSAWVVVVMGRVGAAAGRGMRDGRRVLHTASSRDQLTARVLIQAAPTELMQATSTTTSSGPTWRRKRCAARGGGQQSM